MVCSIGAGILFYPYLFASLGYVMSVIFLIFAAILEGGMLLVFYRCMLMAKEMYPGVVIHRMEDVGRICCGKKFELVFSIVFQLTIAVLAASFFILIGSLMTGFADIGGGAELVGVKVSNFYWTLIFAVPQVIMSWAGNLNKLKYVTNCGTLAIAVLFICQIALASKAMSDDFNANHPEDGDPVAVADLLTGIDSVKLIVGSLTTFLYGFGAVLSAAQVVEDMGPNHVDFPKTVWWLKKNLANKIFGYLARCEFWLKIRW